MYPYEIKLGKTAIKSIRQQTDELFQTNSIYHFNDLMDEFILLKKEIPLIEQTYIYNNKET